MRTEPETKPVEILLVEDNPGDALLTEEVLNENKIRNRLHVVPDGLEALDFLARHNNYADAPRPDLILLDLNLPKKDGREVLKAIKSDSSLRSIPVVVLTTSVAEQDILKSYKLHANCYINKPIDLEQFIDVIRAVENFWFKVVKLPNCDYQEVSTGGAR